MTCALYRHFDADGALLYVGITNNPKRRLAEHKSRSVWGDQIADVSVKWMRSREDAVEAERIAIGLEGPIFNGGQHIPTGDVFRDWLGGTNLNQSELAKALGIAHGTFSQIISGKRRASLRLAAQIEDVSEGAVPMRYWLFGLTAEHTEHGKARLKLVGAAQ